MPIQEYVKWLDLGTRECELEARLSTLFDTMSGPGTESVASRPQ